MEQVKVWMADVVDLDGKQLTAIVIAPHETAARESVNRGSSQVKDLFEIDLTDPRWATLDIRGKLISPARL